MTNKRSKKIWLKVKKAVDNRRIIWYTYIIKGTEERTMADWYLDPETFADDYDELMALLAEEEEEK